MANFLSAQTGLVAYGLKKETSFGADMSGSDTLLSLPFMGDYPERKPRAVHYMGDEHNGAFLGSRSVINTIELAWKHRMRLTTELVAMMCACTADSYAVTGPADTAAYTHTFKFLASGLLASYGFADLNTRNMYVRYGNLIRQYMGCTQNQVMIKSSRGGFAEIECDVAGYKTHSDASGKTFANMESVLTTQPYLKATDSQFLDDYGGTLYNYTTGTFTLANTRNAKMLEYSISFGKLVDVLSLMGSSSQYIGRIDPKSFALNVDAKFEITAIADWLTELEAQSQFGVKIPISGSIITGCASTAYQVNLLIPKAVIVEAAEPKIENDKLIRNVKYQAVSGAIPGTDAASEMLVVTIVDGRANYAI